MQVEIIFETRVQHSQFHDGFQFLGHDGFARIGPQLGCRHAQHDGKSDFLRRNGQRVPETDIHLQRHHRLANGGPQFHADTGVFILGANVLAPHRARIKINAIGFDLQIAQLPENIRQPFRC